MIQFSDKRKGDISEMELCHFFLKEGLEVFKNISCTGLIDIITFNPGISLESSGGVINEINTTPGLHHHYNLLNDHGTPPAVPVLKYLLGIH